MKILGIDTTKKSAKVMILDTEDTKKSYFIDLNEDIKHSEGLFLHIEKAMLETHLEVADLDGFACVVGPGSFTGIRVGMATVKGLNKVLNKSIIAMNSFEILLPTIKQGVILLNSTSTACYYAKVMRSKIVETGMVDKNQISELANGDDVVFLGEEQNLINIEYNKCKIVDNFAELLIKCVIDKMNTMQYGEFVPYYLAISQAERNLKNEQLND